jgi:aspartyl-tRNA(Asn)/glutamyl-tRNA(Gln) amidotransferase subunit C
MAITREDVEHIAFLARLGLSEQEQQTIQEQLSGILEYMQTLAELDTSAIPPTAQVIPLRNVMRDDVVRPSLSADAVLANAPDRDGNFLRVPPVLD